MTRGTFRSVPRKSISKLFYTIPKKDEIKQMPTPSIRHTRRFNSELAPYCILFKTLKTLKLNIHHIKRKQSAQQIFKLSRLNAENKPEMTLVSKCKQSKDSRQRWEGWKIHRCFCILTGCILYGVVKKRLLLKNKTSLRLPVGDFARNAFRKN